LLWASGILFEVASMPCPGGSGRARAFVSAALCGVLALSACAAHYIQVAPPMDLGPYGHIALVTFRGSSTDSGVAELATRRFAESVLNGQGGIEVLELDAADTALKALADRGIAAVFLGTLTLTDPRASGHLSMSSVSVRETVSAELSVKLVSTSTGGTMWRSSARTDGTLGRASLAGLRPSVSIRDKDAAYGEVVDRLVANVTQDFWPTWVKE
jgi:hypothetical protein